jgi:predicted nucleic acid-binding protein
MPFLYDTNIFLEILLNQDKKEQAKEILDNHLDQFFISDFSLHSIGVILIKQEKFKIFTDFLNDIIPYVTILYLPKNKYSDLIEIAEKYNLDFDDSYQTAIAREFDLTVATMDKDFIRVKSIIQVEILK